MAAWVDASKAFRDRVGKVVGKLARDGQVSSSKKEYYTSTIECFARAFEVHVKKQLEKQGRSNTYLSGLSDPSGEESVWPTDAEAEAMAEAFGGLMTAYRKKRHGQTEPIKFSLIDVLKAAGHELPDVGLDRAVISLPSGERIKAKLGGIAPVRMGIGDNGPAIGDTKQVEGRTYRLNRNSRWELVSEDGWGHEGTHTSISALIDDADNDLAQSASMKVPFHSVTKVEADRIKDATGIDLSGYAHNLDGSSWHHILRNHGHELRPGQLSITKEDIEALPLVVSEFDHVQTVGTNSRGLQLIRFKKRINGHVLVVEEIRKKRSLAVVSAYKYPSKKKD
jgi:hypothetical protein